MKKFLFSASVLVMLAGVSFNSSANPIKEAPKASKRLKADPNNGGIKLPKGFGAIVVSEGVGQARHIAVSSKGDIYVKLQKLENGKGNILLQDLNGDGKADVTKSFGNYTGTGMAISNGYLYASSDTSVYRYAMKNGLVDENSKPETIITGLEFYREHSSKPIALDDKGNLYVTFGAPSNACQEKNRVKDSPGMDPCPILEWHGGIWKFDANKLNQKQADGVRYATGLRNCVALDWDKEVGELYALQHGRDQLSYLYPELYNDEKSAELPSEEFFQVKEGSDFGWPYCYYDHIQGKKILAPEYGGDGKKQGRCADKGQPIMAFPGHYAPNDLLFYTGNMFPARYKNGAFVCFHGSWNRFPLNQQGYFVAFIPFGKDGKPSGKYEIFAQGFAGVNPIKSSGDAKHRPMGLAQGADGSLYITDSVKGKIWRVIAQK